MMESPMKAPSKGSIKYYSSNLLDIEKKRISSQGKSGTSRTSTGLSRLSSSVSSLGQMRNIENWINEKSLRRIQERHSIENLDARQLYTTVLKNEENFVQGIDEFLKENELLNLRRKELLYKEWNENVYEPTRRKIQDAIEYGYPVVDSRRRSDYLDYLSYKNKKGDVFLDVISMDEYNPLALLHPASPANIKVRTPRLQDPLLTQERQRIDEERTISRCETGDILSDDEIRRRWLPALPLKPLGRQGTTCNTWLEMPLRYIESPIHVRSRKRMKAESNASNIDFNYKMDIKLVKKQVLPPLSKTPPIDKDTTPQESPRDEKQHVTFELPPTSETIDDEEPKEPTTELTDKAERTQEDLTVTD